MAQNQPRIKNDHLANPGLARPGCLLLSTLAVLLLLAGPVHSQSQGSGLRLLPLPSPNTSQNPQEVPAPSPPPSPEQAVPLPEVADRLSTLDRLLHTINDQLTEDQSLEERTKALRVASHNLTERAGQLEASLREAPTVQELTEMETDWRVEVGKLDRQREPVIRRLTELENYIRQLESETKLWELTRAQYRQAVGTEIVVEGINHALAQTRRTLGQVQEHRRGSLIVQNLLAQQMMVVSGVLDKIRAAEKKYDSMLLRPDRSPLWQIGAASQIGPSFGEQTRQAMSRQLLQMGELLKSGWLSLLLMTLCFLFVSTSAVKLGRKVASWQLGQTGYGDASLFYHHPATFSLVAATWFLLWLPLFAPVFLSQLVASLVSITFLALIPPLFPAGFRPLLYLFTAFYALSRFWSFFASVPQLERLTSVIVGTAVTAAAVWLMRPIRIETHPDVVRAPRFVVRAIWLVLALLIGALAANLFGFFALSKLIGRGVVVSVFSALTVYVLARIAGSLFSLLLRTRWAQLLPSVRLRGDVIYKWVVRAFVILMAVSWALTVLRSFSLADDVLEGLGSILGKRISIGKIGFSLQDVLVFGLVLLASYAISKTVTFFLEEDLLPRFPLQRGVPYAITTVVQYSLLLAGFMMALAAVGLDLTRFTVLVGAFGVGIGFGLQNIFNNLVSGLILLFERPIHLDDIIEINGAVGQVKHIGIRASTIHTGQGADVIVPNSSLVSNQFINWTYMDSSRRVDLKVSVALGTEPECVLKLLSDAAATIPGVEKKPEPVALFSGFGECALNFELRYWVQLKNSPQAESSLAIAVASRLRKAGIEIPFPQRDLHLKSVVTGLTPPLAENNRHSVKEEARQENSV